MDKLTFKRHLYTATDKLVEFTSDLCYNNLAKEYRYIIAPNTRTIDKDDGHLSEKEDFILNKWNQHKGQTLTADQVVELFHNDDKVPVWINMSVYEATEDLTTIDLLTSRRIRCDEELYHQGEITPFHLQVPLPPEHLKIEKGGKFDVNWKKRLDDKKTPKSMLAKVKRLFRTD